MDIENITLNENLTLKPLPPKILYRDVVAQWSRHRAGRRLIASSNPAPTAGPRVIGGALAVWPGCCSKL